jgi:hypothetical protein
MNLYFRSAAGAVAAAARIHRVKVVPKYLRVYFVWK